MQMPQMWYYYEYDGLQGTNERVQISFSCDLTSSARAVLIAFCAMCNHFSDELRKSDNVKNPDKTLIVEEL